MIPTISPTFLRIFLRYNRRYVSRGFHAVRLSAAGAPPPIAADVPIVIYLNHPSWWDPLIGFFLADTFWPRRRHYVPIEAGALRRYRFLSRLGYFGIEKRGIRGASVFLRTGSEILGQPDTALWVTGGGEFSDPRARPVSLRPGLGHLLRRVPNAAFLPLAVEYPFWEERLPEALCRFGAAISGDDQGRMTPSQLTARLEESLQATQDLLAAEAVRRHPDDFQTLLSGRAGVGGIYDTWNRLRAALRGQRFSPRHGDFP